MRASLMAVNKSMACGCEGAGTEKQDEDQSWSWVLPPQASRGPGPEDLPEKGEELRKRVESGNP